MSAGAPVSENQDAVLSLCMWSRETAEQVFDTLSVTDFEPGDQAALAELIQNALYQDQPDIYVYCQVESARTNRPDPHVGGPYLRPPVHSPLEVLRRADSGGIEPPEPDHRSHIGPEQRERAGIEP